MEPFIAFPASSTSSGLSTLSGTCPSSTLSDQSPTTVSAEMHHDPRPAANSAADPTCTSTKSVGSLASPSSQSPVETSPPPALSIDDGVSSEVGQLVTSKGGRAELRSSRQRVAWEEMPERMERRRREWNAQVDRMRTDFFKLKPPTPPADNGSRSSSVVVAADQQRVVPVEPPWTPTATRQRQQFQASFDLSDYTADEITVQTDGCRLIVRARHEQTETGSKTYSREFSRQMFHLYEEYVGQVDIPRFVDASQLRCTLRDNGVLYVEGDAVACSTSPLSLCRGTANPTSSPRSALTVTPPRTQQIASSVTWTPPLSAAPVFQLPDGTYMFHVTVPLGAEFHAGDMTVKTIDRRLIVSAQHDETGPGRRAACREFNHEFDLPDSVDPETVTAHVTDDGQLVIQAPLPPPL